MVIGGEVAQRHPISPGTDHLMEMQKAIAVVKDDVHMEAGRRRVGPRSLWGEPWGR